MLKITMPKNKSSEQNKSSEGSNTVEQTEMTGSVSEVNNLGCDKEILTGKFKGRDCGSYYGTYGNKKVFALCPDCQSKQEKENSYT